VPHGAGDNPRQRLAKLGLKHQRGRFVLDSESQALEEFRKVQSRWDEYASPVARKKAIESYEARARQLDQDLIVLDQQITQLDLLLERRPPHPNSEEKAAIDGITNERDARRVQQNEERAELRRLRSQVPGPRVRQELDVEIEYCRAVCRSALRNLREIIVSTDSKYGELARDKRVQADLDELGRGSPAKYKLGPSPRYKEMVKRVDLIAKSLEAPAETVQPKTEPAQKKKNAPRQKR
jgi:hypothetical protein